jgi:hypothetical protein
MRRTPGIVLTGNAMQAQRGENTQSADQIDDPGVQEILRLAEAANARGVARRRRRFRRRAFALLTAVLVVCAAAAFWFGFGTGDSETAKGSSTPTSIGSAIVPAPATHSIPDFVWPAAKRADHYRVEFLLGARVVHTAKTSVPRLHVTAKELPPGSYRWRVWALDGSGARVGPAVVNASVTIR